MTNHAAGRWLQFAAIVLILFGPIVALGCHPVTAAPNGMLVDLVFWPLDGNPNLQDRASRLMSAISGGVMMGWGMMLWQVATRLYPRDPQLARTLIASGAIVWFVVDSAGSVIAGAPLNAVLNTGFLALFLVPLWLAREPAVS